MLERYLTAKETVVREGYGHEIDWQDSLTFDQMTERDFLREGAWVIVSSGMRELVVRRLFPQLSAAFLDWKSGKSIAERKQQCRKIALRVFSHKGKIDAIVSLAVVVAKEGFAAIRERVRTGGVTYLQTFAYLGPATSYHLAKNLGLDVVKPDRHLCRIADVMGCKSPDALCQSIADDAGEKVSVVDIVFWRFATLRQDYLSILA